MIAFAIVLIIIGSILLAVSSPRKGGDIKIEYSDVSTSLPEITGPMKIPLFILGLILIGVGLWMGVSLFAKSLEEETTQPMPTLQLVVINTPLPLVTSVSIIPIDTPQPQAQTPSQPANTGVPIFTPQPPPVPTGTLNPMPQQSVTVRVDDIISKIKGEDGELQRILTWWREDDYGKKDGQQLNVSSLLPNEKCFGMAWNTNEYGYHTLIVFQKATIFTFADGGWYVKVCVPNNVLITPEDIGEIQADWLGKRNGIDNHPWRVMNNN